MTFTPSDIDNPVALYMVDTDEKFEIKIRSKELKLRLNAKNPVGGARFFDFIVKAFIRHILGFGKESGGIFGKVSAYYGTVEQQGRLTLHLHMLIWVANCMRPQEI